MLLGCHFMNSQSDSQYTLKDCHVLVGKRDNDSHINYSVT